MEDKVSLLAPYNDEKKYFHLLLSKIFFIANKRKKPEKYLNAALNNLRKNYPGQITFVAWDNKGKVIKNLTDEKRFHYIMRKLWRIFKEVRDNAEIKTPEEIATLPILRDNLKIVKQFLGRIFIPKTLINPYLKGRNATLILSDFGENKPYFWFHIGKRVSLMAFIGWKATENDFGIKKIVQSLNRANDKYKIGFVSISNVEQPFPTVPDYLVPDLTSALARFEYSAESQTETDRALFLVRMINAKIRGFSYVIKDKNSSNIRQKINSYLLRGTLFYFTGLLFLYWVFFTLHSFVSIRWKLTALFLYANLIPLSILAFVSLDYLQNKSEAEKNNIRALSNRILRDFDARYESLKDEYAKKLNKKLSMVSKLIEKDQFNDKEKQKLKEFLYQFDIAECYLTNKTGKLEFAFGGNGKPIKHAVTYARNLGLSILKYANNELKNNSKDGVFNRMLDPNDSNFIRNSIKNSHRILPMNFGNSIRIGYWGFMGDRENFNSKYILILIWNEEIFQKIYIQKNIAKLSQNPNKIKVYAYDTFSKKIFPELPSKDSDLINFLENAAERKTNYSNRIKQNGFVQISTAMLGKNLNKIVLAAFYPMQKVEKILNNFKIKMFLGGILSLLLTAIVGWLLSFQFLTPIKNLNQGAIAIGKQDFRHRIQKNDNDEFGHLIEVLNRVIEGLGEMEVAKIVQESLFPESNLLIPPYEIYGKSMIMTTLGGDYLDFIDAGNNKTGIVLGDVAGHGVPAGLIMAMAKAGVTMASEEERNVPTSLVTKIHKIIHGIKNRKLKRMMTFQYLLLDSQQDMFTLANAGQCFPLIVKPQTKETKFVELVGSPIGLTKNLKIQNKSFHLESGEAVILYTDGIIEAQNPYGENLGFPNFEKIAIEAYDTNPEIYYTNLYQKYVEWTKHEPDDDTTIIIIVKQHQKQANNG